MALNPRPQPPPPQPLLPSFHLLVFRPLAYLHDLWFLNTTSTALADSLPDNVSHSVRLRLINRVSTVLRYYTSEILRQSYLLNLSWRKCVRWAWNECSVISLVSAQPISLPLLPLLLTLTLTPCCDHFPPCRSLSPLRIVFDRSL